MTRGIEQERLSNGGYVERIKGVGTYYWLNGRHHREDGPAIIMENGHKYWIVRGQYHREDGPAIELSDAKVAWYYHGILYPTIKNNEEWLRLMKMKALL